MKSGCIPKKRILTLLFLIGIIMLLGWLFFSGTSESLKEPGPLYEKDPKPAPLDGYVICVDPGHGIYPQEMRGAKNPEGTRGAFQAEHELNLKVGLLLEEMLKDLGAQVAMTRTQAQTSLDNRQRADFANELGADLCVKLHADSSPDPQIRGISVLIPGSCAGNDEEMLQDSAAAGEIILSQLLLSTGAENLGLVERTDLTGFYWSEVPVVLVEMGFMSHPQEDALLQEPSYQRLLARGIADGIVRCLVKGV